MGAGYKEEKQAINYLYGFSYDEQKVLWEPLLYFGSKENFTLEDIGVTPGYPDTSTQPTIISAMLQVKMQTVKAWTHTNTVALQRSIAELTYVSTRDILISISNVDTHKNIQM